MKSSSPRKSRAISTQWARPSGASWGMYVTRTPQRDPSPTAARISSARAVADDDAELLDPGVDHVLEAVEQDRLVRHRDELLGARMGDRPQADCPNPPPG